MNAVQQNHTPQPGDNDKFVFAEKYGLWRWKRIAPNSEVVGASTESYRNYADCFTNAQRNGLDPERHTVVKNGRRSK